jgi:Pyridoxamine 5'-phosphate oxidase
MKEPVTTLDPRYSVSGAIPTPWAETREALKRAELAWVVSLRNDGSPHATLVVPVWAEDAFHFTTGDKEQKYKNLRAENRVLLQVGKLDWKDGLDIVVEGRASLATDPQVLAQLAAAWRERWDGRWSFEVRSDHLGHPDGFDVLTYSVQPERILSFAEGRFGQTLHLFGGG